MNLLQWNCAERRSQRTLGICRTAPKSPSNATIRVIRVGHDREDTAGYVRFAPKADKRADVSLSPLSAISGLTHRSKKAPLFGHLVGIRLTGVTEHWIGTAALVRLDVGGPDDLGPLFDLVGNEFSEFGGCQ